MKIGTTEHDSAFSKTLRNEHLDRLWLGRIGLSALVALVGFAFSEPVCAKRAAPDLTLTVRVYDYTQASPTILARAEREAGRIFREAGLTLAWLDCTSGPTSIPQDPCQQAIEAEDVRLRILLAPVPNGLQDSTFGFAIAPALATVYYETALGFAKYDERGFEAPIVLGCVIAHEIGHLLLGSNGHSVSGIMRARWDRGDAQEALMGAMLFTPKQARLIRAETQRRSTKPFSSETRKAERRSIGDHSSIRDSWPIAFSDCPRGPRVAFVTRNEFGELGAIGVGQELPLRPAKWVPALARLEPGECCGPLSGQTGLAQGQQRVDVSRVNNSHEIPFQLHESYLIAVEGRIGNLDKLKCLIDTGASHSVMNKRIAQRLQLPREPGRAFKIEQYITVEWAVLPELQIGPITFRDAKFIVDDRSLDIPRGFDAIIGLDLLAKTGGFLIDYAAKMISFRNISASQSNRLTCLTAQMILQGHPVNLVADTGMHGFLLYEDLRQRFPDLKFRMEKTVSIGQIRAKQAKVSSMRLGSRESEAVVYLIRRPSQGTSSDVDGYFGMDALNTNVVEFDFENRRLRWN